LYDQWEYQIPKATSEENLIEIPIKISLGIITDIYIGFPRGCGYYDEATDTTYHLARTRLFWHSSIIVPRSPKSFIGADDYVVHAGPMKYRILKGEPELTWQLWNLDEGKSHKLWLGVNWMTKEEVEADILALESLNLTMKDMAKILRATFLGEE